jgi:hypothetical protein
MPIYTTDNLIYARKLVNVIEAAMPLLGVRRNSAIGYPVTNNITKLTTRYANGSADSIGFASFGCIAGGFIRDTLFQRPVSDCDVFVVIPKHAYKTIYDRVKTDEHTLTYFYNIEQAAYELQLNPKNYTPVFAEDGPFPKASTTTVCLPLHTSTSDKGYVEGSADFARQFMSFTTAPTLLSGHLTVRQRNNPHTNANESVLTPLNLILIPDTHDLLGRDICDLPADALKLYKERFTLTTIHNFPHSISRLGMFPVGVENNSGLPDDAHRIGFEVITTKPCEKIIEALIKEPFAYMQAIAYPIRQYHNKKYHEKICKKYNRIQWQELAADHAITPKPHRLCFIPIPFSPKPLGELVNQEETHNE